VLHKSRRLRKSGGLKKPKASNMLYEVVVVVVVVVVTCYMRLLLLSANCKQTILAALTSSNAPLL
jgi:hypothetical protein